MQKPFKSSQSGFSIVSLIIGAMVVLVALTSYLVMSASGHSSGFASGSYKIKAAALMEGASSISQAYDQRVRDGVPPLAISFNANPVTGLFFMLSTGVDAPVVSSSWLITADLGSSEGFYVHKSAGLQLNGVGTQAGEDAAVILSGLDKPVCEEINRVIYGNTGIPYSGKSVFEWVNGASVSSPISTSAINVSAIAALAGRPAGCTSADGTVGLHYLYYKTLLPA